MMAARIVLLRHGATVEASVCQGTRHDAPLSDEGRRQAGEAVARLGSFDRCVVSPLGRAQATAAAFACPTEVDARWRERDFGSWEGRPWAEVVDDVPDDARARPDAYLAFTPDGGEAWTAVTTRVGAALEDAADRGGDTLVVTHGGPIRAAVAHVLGVPLARTVGLRPDHGTSTWLTRSGGGWQLDRFGW